MTFHKYDKVERLEKDEVKGILEGDCTIFEKLDGANAQIYYTAASFVYGSRNSVKGTVSAQNGTITGDSFIGLPGWVTRNMDKLNQFFYLYPNVIVYGEWAIRHTVQYNPQYYQQFYAFDFYDRQRQYWYPYDPTSGPFAVWNNHNLPLVKPDDTLHNPTITQLNTYLTKPSNYGPTREGIVIKNYEYRNKHNRCVYAKLLNKEFKEVKEATQEIDDFELMLCNTYCTDYRIQKTIDKISMEVKKLEIQLIPRVTQTIYTDILEEELLDIIKKYKNPTINFHKFRQYVTNKAKLCYIGYITKQTEVL